jgi:hypothetical protein
MGERGIASRFEQDGGFVKVVLGKERMLKRGDTLKVVLS